MPYKIFATKLQRFGPLGVIIITAYKNAGGFPEAESFLIVPEEDAIKNFNRLSFDVQSFKDSPVTLNDDFMLDEALAQALIDLDTYLQERYSNEPDLVPADAPNFIKRSDDFLVHKWVRGFGTAALDRVARQTKCQPLKETLRQIFSLPHIDRYSA